MTTNTCDRCNSLAVDDAVRIEHRNNLEDVHLSQCASQRLVAHQEIQRSYTFTDNIQTNKLNQ